MKTMIVGEINNQNDRVLLSGGWGYYVIAKPTDVVKIGDKIEYKPYGMNFGWFMRVIASPSAERNNVLMTKIPMTPQTIDWYKGLCAAQERAEKAEAEAAELRAALEPVLSFYCDYLDREVQMRGQKELVDLTLNIKYQTASAWLVDDGKRSVWLPKSVAQDNGDGTFTLPLWLATEKELI
jgi:hypothetical protein